MIALVEYGAGNLRSVEFALEYLEIPWRRVGDPSALEGAAAIILPGVGSAAGAMNQLRERGLEQALRESELPLLGICLGMQLLTDRSEEGGVDVECLGLVRGDTRLFGETRRGLEPGADTSFPNPVPHIGWNETRLSADPIFEGLDATEHFYFLHSYRVHTPAEYVTARADYGGSFPAAIRNGHRVAVQFHPEKSGPSGLRLLANFCCAGRS